MSSSHSAGRRDIKILLIEDGDAKAFHRAFKTPRAGDISIETMSVMDSFWRYVELPVIDVRRGSHG